MPIWGATKWVGPTGTEPYRYSSSLYNYELSKLAKHRHYQNVWIFLNSQIHIKFVNRGKWISQIHQLTNYHEISEVRLFDM